MPDIVCYEKQPDWGGQFNLTHKTGLNEYGELVHSCMYRDLISHAPKETAEFGDYTFDRHFGWAVPSYLPRECLLDYFIGRWVTLGGSACLSTGLRCRFTSCLYFIIE